MRFLAAAYKYKAQSYEDLFTFVMRHRFPDFRPVRPVGSVGDRKNDGFISTSGIYFQVFAPEDLERTDKKGAKKVRDDFLGLRTHWNDVSKIRQYRFVVNDRYHGLGPETTQAIEKLKSEFPDVTFGSFLCYELESEFTLLGPDIQIELFGALPAELDLTDVELISFQEVIDHLLADREPINYSAILPSPKFEEKISFNNLGSVTANLLRTASFDGTSLLENLFHFQRNLSEVLAARFRRLYAEAVDIAARHKSGTVTGLVSEKSDGIFFYVLSCSMPANTRNH